MRRGFQATAQRLTPADERRVIQERANLANDRIGSEADRRDAGQLKKPPQRLGNLDKALSPGSLLVIDSLDVGSFNRTTWGK